MLSISVIANPNKSWVTLVAQIMQWKAHKCKNVWRLHRGSICAVLLFQHVYLQGVALTHLPKCPLRRDNPWVPHAGA